MHTITVTIDDQADVKVEVSGLTGPGCLKITEALEKSLGQTVASQHKPEFHQVNNVSQKAGETAGRKP